jgi:hypothetical protein
MRRYRWFALVAAAMLVAGEAAAASVTMNAGDGFGASSFNAAGQWSNAAAPSAGNDYSNNNFLLRTPADGNNYTFAGDSLTITGPGLAPAAANEALMWKGTGTTSVITVNNLTLNGGQLRHGQGDGDTVTFAGNIAIGANGGNIATQGGMFISAAISGSSTLRILPNGSGGAVRTVTLSSSANTFTGNIELINATQSRLTLADDANLKFVIGATGVNNSVFGPGVLGLNGDFVLDLTGASSTIGDSWTLVSGPTTTYGATFTVAGFSDLGGGQWRSGNYLFDTATSVLSVTPVPEPATFALVGVALAGLAACRTRRTA